jgi:hypothetical protein
MLWVSFLRGNHWTKKVDGKWQITQKGQDWIDRYDYW